MQDYHTTKKEVLNENQKELWGFAGIRTRGLSHFEHVLSNVSARFPTLENLAPEATIIPLDHKALKINSRFRENY